MPNSLPEFGFLLFQLRRRHRAGRQLQLLGGSQFANAFWYFQ
jgi:hypothetical protein